ncbi:hypothetical protein EDC01DRAFT_776566 [Geopyxis carbonaria]|nr:hypothetical protein EDC01DRAFT_776566 [Geopyxis carbonaria]
MSKSIREEVHKRKQESKPRTCKTCKKPQNLAYTYPDGPHQAIMHNPPADYTRIDPNLPVNVTAFDKKMAKDFLVSDMNRAKSIENLVIFRRFLEEANSQPAPNNQHHHERYREMQGEIDRLKGLIRCWERQVLQSRTDLDKEVQQLKREMYKSDIGHLGAFPKIGDEGKDDEDYWQNLQDRHVDVCQETAQLEHIIKQMNKAFNDLDYVSEGKNVPKTHN